MLIHIDETTLFKIKIDNETTEIDTAIQDVNETFIKILSDLNSTLIDEATQLKIKIGMF